MPDDRAFVYPTSSVFGRLAEMLANAAPLKRLRRAALRWLPYPVLESDIVDVIYLNWVIDLSRVRHLLPDGIEVWEHDGRTVLSILTYRHGAFGPAMLGPLRRIFPSPLQSNWRLYVQSIHGQPPAQPTVLFLKNVIDQPALRSRRAPDERRPADRSASLDEACPSRRTLPRGHRARVEPRAGSAPGVAPARSEASALAFVTAFGDLESATRWLFLQDAAIAPVPDFRGLLSAKSRSRLTQASSCHSPPTWQRFGVAFCRLLSGPTSRFASW